jgi:hypothetical protein
VPKVCAYVMRFDSGLAPNPFYGVCTLGLCTPNHSRADIWPGDWIIGLPSAQIRREMGSQGWRMFYAMQVDERMGLDAYYRDPRFQSKIPKRGGSLIEQRGDNFHRWDGQRLIHTNESTEHEGFTSDISGDRVFIANRFWYFGKDAVVLPDDLWAKELVALFEGSSKGIRYAYGRRHDPWTPEDFAQFQTWLHSQQVPAHAIPYHLRDRFTELTDHTGSQRPRSVGAPTVTVGAREPVSTARTALQTIPSCS